MVVLLWILKTMVYRGVGGGTLGEEPKWREDRSLVC